MGKLEGMKDRLTISCLIHEISGRLKSEEACCPRKRVARRTVAVASDLLGDTNNDRCPQFFMH